MRVEVDKNGNLKLPNWAYDQLIKNDDLTINKYIDIAWDSIDSDIVLRKHSILHLTPNELYWTIKDFSYMLYVKYNSSVRKKYELKEKNYVKPFLSKDKILKFLRYDEEENIYIFEDLIYEYAFEEWFVEEYLKKIEFTEQEKVK